jgi:hypothetical protein
MRRLINAYYRMCFFCLWLIWSASVLWVNRIWWGAWLAAFLAVIVGILAAIRGCYVFKWSLSSRVTIVGVAGFVVLLASVAIASTTITRILARRFWNDRLKTASPPTAALISSPLGIRLKDVRVGYPEMKSFGGDLFSPNAKPEWSDPYNESVRGLSIRVELANYGKEPFYYTHRGCRVTIVSAPDGVEFPQYSLGILHFSLTQDYPVPAERVEGSVAIPPGGRIIDAWVFGLPVGEKQIGDVLGGPERIIDAWVIGLPVGEKQIGDVLVEVGQNVDDEGASRWYVPKDRIIFEKDRSEAGRRR